MKKLLFLFILFCIRGSASIGASLLEESIEKREGQKDTWTGSEYRKDRFERFFYPSLNEAIHCLALSLPKDIVHEIFLFQYEESSLFKELEFIFCPFFAEKEFYSLAYGGNCIFLGGAASIWILHPDQKKGLPQLFIQNNDLYGAVEQLFCLGNTLLSLSTKKVQARRRSSSGASEYEYHLWSIESGELIRKLSDEEKEAIGPCPSFALCAEKIYSYAVLPDHNAPLLCWASDQLKSSEKVKGTEGCCDFICSLDNQLFGRRIKNNRLRWEEELVPILAHTDLKIDDEMLGHSIDFVCFEAGRIFLVGKYEGRRASMSRITILHPATLEEEKHIDYSGEILDMGYLEGKIFCIDGGKEKVIVFGVPKK